MNDNKKEKARETAVPASPVQTIVKCFICFFTGGHKWTSAAIEGKPPTPEQVGNGLTGFFDYAEMYCEKCGAVSEVSTDWRNRNE